MKPPRKCRGRTEGVLVSRFDGGCIRQTRGFDSRDVENAFAADQGEYVVAILGTVLGSESIPNRRRPLITVRICESVELMAVLWTRIETLSVQQHPLVKGCLALEYTQKRGEFLCSHLQSLAYRLFKELQIRSSFEVARFEVYACGYTSLTVRGSTTQVKFVRGPAAATTPMLTTATLELKTMQSLH